MKYLLRLLPFIALLSLLGCNNDSDESSKEKGEALTKVVLMTDWYPQPEHGGFYQALAKGYYKEAGLDVEIRSGANLSDIRPLVATGQVDFAISNIVLTLVGISRDLPLTTVFPYFQHDLQCIMSHPEAGIKTLYDLDGREVMIQASSTYAEYMKKIMGIKLQLIPLDFSLARFVSNKDFIQQCFLSSEPVILKQQGIETSVIPLSKSGFDPYRVVYSSQKFIKNNPEVAKAFALASIKGWQDFMTGDPSPALELIAKENKQQKIPLMLQSLAAMKKYAVVTGDPSRQQQLGKFQLPRLEQQVKQLKELKMINDDIKVDNTIFSLDLLPDLYME